MYTTACLALFVMSIFNIITILVLISSRSHRRKPSTYPLLSFLTGCLVQGLTAAPLFIFKEMARGTDIAPRWLCVVQRSSYFLSHHTVKWSLLVVSIERFLAVKFPYQYCHHIRRGRMIVFLAMLWLVTVAIDSVPFYNGRNSGDRCLYSPHAVWSLVVITIYNIIPFTIMVVCYALVWKIAVNAEIHDRKMSRVMTLPPNTLADEDDSTKRSRVSAKVIRATTRLRSSVHEMVPRLLRKSGRQESVSVTTNLMETSAIKSRRAFLLELKATKTAFVLVVVYVCCWGPLGVFYTIDQFCNKCLSSGGSQRYTRVAIKGLCFSSSIIVPVVYCWWSSDYKNAAKRLYRRMRESFTRP